MKNFYIDDTGVEVDNRDIRTTVLRYEDEPDYSFTVDIRFVLWLVFNALDNAYEELPERVVKAVDTLLKHLK